MSKGGGRSTGGGKETAGKRDSSMTEGRTERNKNFTTLRNTSQEKTQNRGEQGEKGTPPPLQFPAHVDNESDNQNVGD